MIGNGLKDGDNGALTVSSEFTAKVPDLTVADAHVVADTHATFVTVGGQNLRLSGRQRERKRASPSSPVVGPHPSAMPLDNALGDIEAESDAASIIFR